MKKVKTFLNAGIAAVWFINGLFCKLLDMVPRHQMIVSRILGDEYAFLLTKMIGTLEVLLAVWIITGIRHRFCALLQIVLVGTMNFIEIAIAPDLLLYGPINALPATIFMVIVYFNSFVFKQVTPLLNKKDGVS